MDNSGPRAERDVHCLVIDTDDRTAHGKIALLALDQVCDLAEIFSADHTFSPSIFISNMAASSDIERLKATLFTMICLAWLVVVSLTQILSQGSMRGSAAPAYPT